MDTVEAIMGQLTQYCGCCFAKDGRRNGKNHTLFGGCARFFGLGYLNGVGWREKKKSVVLPEGYCYFCSIGYDVRPVSLKLTTPSSYF